VSSIHGWDSLVWIDLEKLEMAVVQEDPAKATNWPYRFPTEVRSPLEMKSEMRRFTKSS
jgi:hypothetical protein